MPGPGGMGGPGMGGPGGPRGMGGPGMGGPGMGGHRPPPPPRRRYHRGCMPGCLVYVMAALSIVALVVFAIVVIV